MFLKTTLECINKAIEQRNALQANLGLLGKSVHRLKSIMVIPVVGADSTIQGNLLLKISVLA